MIIQAMIDPDYYKFLNAGDLISRGGTVSFDNFETVYAAVEKYLPDNAALSAAREAGASYFT